MLHCPLSFIVFDEMSALILYVYKMFFLWILKEKNSFQIFFFNSVISILTTKWQNVVFFILILFVTCSAPWVCGFTFGFCLIITCHWKLGCCPPTWFSSIEACFSTYLHPTRCLPQWDFWLNHKGLTPLWNSANQGFLASTTLLPNRKVLFLVHLDLSCLLPW